MKDMEKSSFKFKLPLLKNIIYKLNDNYQGDNVDKLNIKGKTKIGKEEGNIAIVNFAISIFEEKRNIDPFYLYIEMEAKFTWDDGISNEMLDNLLNVNAPSIILSYIRPYVTTLTTGSGIGPIVLPPLNLTKNEAEYI